MTMDAPAANTTSWDVLPLEGVRVLDLSFLLVGNICTKVMADMGAEVIKVESMTRYDPVRGPMPAPDMPIYPGGIAGDRPYNRHGRFNEYNRGKFGITLDLKHPEGLALMRELVRTSDIVVEAFSVGVLDRLGLGYSELVRLRPDIILLSLSGCGGTGPEADYTSQAPTQDAMSGNMSITGYAGGPPMMTGVSYGASIGGTWAATAALMALWGRQQTGTGSHIDFSQREASLALVPEVLLEYQLNDRILGPQGNRDPAMAPHGCYPCLGDDAWIVIAVSDDDEWRRLAEAMSRPDLADDDRWATLPSRLQYHDELDPLISDWTITQDKYALMHLLQRSGVTAEAVLDAGEVLTDPHYRARGYFQDVLHSEVGVYPHHSSPWRFESGYLPIRHSGPCLGEHNAQILGGVLGLSDEELVRLETEGVTGSAPTKSAR